MHTPVVTVDALATVAVARAEDALKKLIEGEPLSLEDQVALARLKSYSIERWYEPVVTFMPGPQISAENAEFFAARLDKVRDL